MVSRPDATLQATAAEVIADRQEKEARESVESLRAEVQAMGAALAEFQKRKNPGAGGLRGTQQPGNRFDRKRLMETFKTPAGR